LWKRGCFVEKANNLKKLAFAVILYLISYIL